MEKCDIKLSPCGTVERYYLVKKDGSIGSKSYHLKISEIKAWRKEYDDKVFLEFIKREFKSVGFDIGDDFIMKKLSGFGIIINLIR